MESCVPSVILEFLQAAEFNKSRIQSASQSWLNYSALQSYERLVMNTQPLPPIIITGVLIIINLTIVMITSLLTSLVLWLGDRQQGSMVEEWEKGRDTGGEWRDHRVLVEWRSISECQDRCICWQIKPIKTAVWSHSTHIPLQVTEQQRERKTEEER